MGKIKKVIKLGLKAVANPRRTKELVKFAARRQSINKERRKRYIRWFKAQTLTSSELESQRQVADQLAYCPLISVLVPTYNTNPKHLRECLESVISQTYTNWEICIADDASPNKETKDVIREYVKKYKNIRATFSKTNNHISVSSNIALDMAKGEFVSLLDHDDLLLPNALFETVMQLNEYPKTDLVYTDEDKLEKDKYHVEPFFKPDWSPDFLNSCNVITHFATIRTSVMKDVKGFMPGTHGAQDWDLFLRITEQTNNVRHIPKILYTWRKSETSTAHNADSKPYAYINQGKVLRSSLVRKNENAIARPHPAALGFWRVEYAIKKPSLVSIIIHTKNNFELIQQCVDSILEKTTYANFEIVIVDTGSTDKRVAAYYEKLLRENPQIKVVEWTKQPFNFSEACNVGAKNSNGEYLLFLNNDTEVITSGWIQGLLGHAQRKQVGMVGAMLQFPNGTIQHAGVVLSERDVAFHPFYGDAEILDIANYIYIANVRNTSAVTAACSMVSRKKFDEVGGFDTKLRVTYNDVDLCLRLLDKGYFNVYNASVKLFHHESMSVGRSSTAARDMTEFNEAKALMQKRWAKYLKHDPYYNANFEQFGPGYRLPETK
jgi:GT2 family glycosyltransferase